MALVYPNADYVLPSLWEAVAGPRPVEWAERDERGKFLGFTPDFDRVWRWKDELPARRLACAGQHAARPVTLVAPGLVAELYTLTGRSGRPEDFRAAAGLTALEREIAEAVLESGPCSRPQVRRLLGTEDKKRVDRAIEALQRRLILTNVGVDDREPGWPAVILDVLARHWRPQLRRLPTESEARTVLARTVLRTAGDVSAADVAAALGWRRREATAVLEGLAAAGEAVERDEDGIRVFSRT